jgi:hypothetical protein
MVESTSTNGTSATHRAPQFRIGIGNDSHQLAAGRPALDCNPPGRSEAFADQPLRRIDEIVEAVGALVELAVEKPAITEIVAAADMSDRAGEAAIEQAQPAVEKLGGMA